MVLHGNSSRECMTCPRYTISYLCEQCKLIKTILIRKERQSFRPSDHCVLITLAFSLILFAFYAPVAFLPRFLQQTVSFLRASVESYPYQSWPDHFYERQLKPRGSQTWMCFEITTGFLANPKASCIKPCRTGPRNLHFNKSPPCSPALPLRWFWF